MKVFHRFVLVLGVFLCFWSLLTFSAQSADPIIIGVPTSLGFLEGTESYNSALLAVEEINAKGGVNIKGEKQLLKLESIDIRDAAPGVPVPEALLGIEKIILEKKVKAIVVGPFPLRGPPGRYGLDRQIQGPHAGHHRHGPGLRQKDPGKS